MNPKYQKVCADIAKLEGKAADIQKQLNERQASEAAHHYASGGN